ncbi:MFS transporter [Achromobacter sp. AONIH1]|uniref:MFS transporter n=1 Tax=Achromobacter sp. AONIH1 TaxID=1758194 RepID=UPI000CD2A3DB|nr:MFS transporter [Achromobacter sp. AONIH1]AUT48540.1 MFS transporter [Achromobacter sp. AONIH1]
MSTISSESLACPVIQPGKLSRRGATAFHAFVLMSFLAASAAPTPLYRVYQQEWGFSATLLTVVFGAYALALLTALLTAGRLSDHIGRRPVIALALLLQSVAMCGFLLASGPGWLVGARLLQGAATGLATASVGAALLDLHRERGALINGISPMIGMAAGALGSTALLVHAPDPLHTVYALLLALFLLALALLWRVPETATRRDGAWASLRPRITVPPQARKALLGVTPANVAVWMLGGFYLSLMPSLIVSATQARSPWLGGFAVTALTLSGAVAIALVALRRVGTFRTLLSGEIALASGLLLILIAANAGYPALLLAGSIVAGLGFGATFLGAVRTVLPLAEPHERAGLMGAFYVESYLANSVPTMIAGYMAQRAGLLAAADAYGAIILALAMAAIVLAVTRRRACLRQAAAGQPL